MAELTPEQFEDACEEADLGDDLKSYTDRKVNEGVQTNAAKLNAEHETKLADLKKSADDGAAKDRTSKIKTELKNSGLAEGLAPYVIVSNDDEIKGKVETLKQDLVDLQIVKGSLPKVGDGSLSATEMESKAKSYGEKISPKKE